MAFRATAPGSDAAMDTPESLPQTLALERLEVNLFRGVTPEATWGRIFGGQVIAQSLLAAYGTVEGRVCHSLHCYFIRPGDPQVPIIFDVDRSRDGGSFTTRRVVAIQHGQQIFNLAASFQTPEQGLEHQASMPDVPGPEGLPEESRQHLAMLEAVPEEVRKELSRQRPIEMRAVEAEDFAALGGREPMLGGIWMRARDEIGDDPVMQQTILAYASDMQLLWATLRPHGVHGRQPGLQAASLDHAMWLHRPSNFNDWHLYVQDSPSTSGGRGLVRGSIYSRDGALVASVAQEGLIRIRKPA